MDQEITNKKIALTIPTGRPNVRNVVSAFLENARTHGYNLKNFSVYLSIDLDFQGAKESDFKLESWVEKAVNTVAYITLEDRKKLSEEFYKHFNVNKETSNKLFSGGGYSRLRNSALLWATRDGNDIAICIDDDEAPQIPCKSEKGKITWKNLDFFTPHIQAILNGADVTRGPYMGYLSPIPSDFEKDIPEEIRIKLGEALALGNEVIAKHSFLDLMNKIRYLQEKNLANGTWPFEVTQGKNGKAILAGNMAVNLQTLREGKTPLFYTPEGARGEDAIFALQLEELRVVEVGSFIFHDPFGMYPKIFEGTYPKELENIPVTLQTKNRFYEALIGWLKYAPILIFMTANDMGERDHKIQEMTEKIKGPTEELARILNCPEMEGCSDILKTYVKRAENDFFELSQVQEVWKTKILPTATSN